MRTCFWSILLSVVTATCGGCIMYAADSPFLSYSRIRHFGDEMQDLKSALDRGAITRDEYEREKIALETSFKGGWGVTSVDETGDATHSSTDGRDHIVTRPLTREQADQITPRTVEQE